MNVGWWPHAQPVLGVSGVLWGRSADPGARPCSLSSFFQQSCVGSHCTWKDPFTLPVCKCEKRARREDGENAESCSTFKHSIRLEERREFSSPPLSLLSLLILLPSFRPATTPPPPSFFFCASRHQQVPNKVFSLAAQCEPQGVDVS